MTLQSLRFRLLSAAALSVSVALALAGFGLVALFEHHVERRLDAELGIHLKYLVGHIELTDDGHIHVAGNSPNPSFQQPLSGRYWQIQDEVRPTLLRSRSLWDFQLALADDDLRPGVVHRHELEGPAGHSLLVREQQFILHPRTEARRLRVAVAIDRADLLAARQAFTADILPYLGLLALAFLVASYAQVRMGLSPLKRVRSGVFAVREGQTNRLANDYPDEVSPLVDEINELLEARDKAVESARAWTADLAHGLNTPLTALGADARRLRRKGDTDIADDLDHLVQVMRSRVDRELIRARLRAAGTANPRQTPVTPVVDGVVRTLQRTPKGQLLSWRVEIPEMAVAAMPDDYLAELIGNLLENACKWATTLVEITARYSSESVLIDIEDDGPGVAEKELDRLGQRGLRLDEHTAGSGLGLAIVGDICAAYSGGFGLERSELGGLAVRVRLPSGVLSDAR
ncbi:MAG: HAMP domain-containing histidine kinase [Candidatus Thiodiazotropha sp. (ex Epidulcina cf. delphinae)]|nr:HAMP domain-containing histidine kinase [Candidatus Thiodiazotropha sp. (ex Epidulcina cf. delphinae)]